MKGRYLFWDRESASPVGRDLVTDNEEKIKRWQSLSLNPWNILQRIGVLTPRLPPIPRVLYLWCEKFERRIDIRNSGRLYLV